VTTPKEICARDIVSTCIRIVGARLSNHVKGSSCSWTVMRPTKILRWYECPCLGSWSWRKYHQQITIALYRKYIYKSVDILQQTSSWKGSVWSRCDWILHAPQIFRRLDFRRYWFPWGFALFSSFFFFSWNFYLLEGSHHFVGRLALFRWGDL
jgi:hypothetical protein